MNVCPCGLSSSMLEEACGWVNKGLIEDSSILCLVLVIFMQRIERRMGERGKRENNGGGYETLLRPR